MKKQINRNILWAQKIVAQLYFYGVRDVCISPGSRNTPLTLAFAANKKIKKNVIIDERSSGFFALGLSKSQKSITAVLTTSGTAVAELYPAIIEAYFEKIPLIILTADRPHYLRNTGANQTINQDDIFHNHIRSFADLGLPGISYKSYCELKNKIDNSLKILFTSQAGPIHFNIQFEKPFEPSKFTDILEKSLIDKVDLLLCKENTLRNINQNRIPKQILKTISDTKNILIVSGNQSEGTEKTYLPKIAKMLKAPVIAGILSPLRLSNNLFVIKNASSFLRYQHVRQKTEPDLILQFGFTSISNSILDFIAQSKAEKISVNPYNEKFDPSLTTKFIVQASAKEFYKCLIENRIRNNELNFFESVKRIDSKTQHFKEYFIKNQQILFEWQVYSEVLRMITKKSNLMISNSLPIRDFDYLVNGEKQINIFSNRGASGIDGIISTAAGIYQSSGLPTYLVIGDLAFLYDLNALHLIKQKNIPLKIILINNNGGGIFELLPIAKEKIEFEKYFKTPIDISFSKIVKSFGGFYSNPRSINLLNKNLKAISSLDNFSVTELNINSAKSTELRMDYWKQLSEQFDL